MKSSEIKIGGEYAVKYGYAAKGELPLRVVRVKVVATYVSHKIKRRHEFGRGGYYDDVKGTEVEVLEILFDPRASALRSGAAKDKPRVPVGRVLDRRYVAVGDRYVVESGRDFVAPWDDYAEQRERVEHAQNEQEAAKWERRERRKIIADRLRALGFTVADHGSPWREGFVAGADYTEADGRVSLEALDRLVLMAERAHASGIPVPPRDDHADRLNSDGKGDG